ncbi:MAG TPA: NAD-dependent epimerase/dehydratase family protein [Solirubrobacteraceae bacterium]|nr:NAD-dependent epimerase/dehydratase family protein [Solirubrobacteraceae bacterium]
MSPRPRGVRPAGSGRGLTVAVTGPTGEIGRPFVQALERTREVERILGMARRPFDPSSLGWRKTEYRQGDITDRGDVDALVQGADVVVHLAFIVLGASDATRDINLEGSRNVFQAAVDAGVKRLVYTSSVAAYGFHEDNPVPLDEEVPARGTEAHPYSAQKAELENVLHQTVDGRVDTYVFRPCIVAGPQARMLIEAIPYVRIGERLPRVLRALFDQVPILKPVIPDPGVPFQLVHHDDVASALKAAVLGRGEPGVYNLAADGEITMSDLAEALRWYSVPVPDLAVDATAEIVSRIPFLPAEATWVNAARVPVVMDTSKARRQLRWRPRHDTRATLQATVEAYRPDLEAGHDDAGD